MTTEDTYCRLLRLLDEQQISYRLIDHPPEGTTEIVSRYRGHPVAQAAKCLVLMIKIGKKVTRYVLAVVPGDRRVDFGAIKALFGASYVAFAAAEVAEQLAGSVPGTVLPFALDERLVLVADPAVVTAPTLYFNAARLDRSIAIGGPDYLAVARPQVAPICAAG